MLCKEVIVERVLQCMHEEHSACMFCSNDKPLPPQCMLQPLFWADGVIACHLLNRHKGAEAQIQPSSFLV